MRKCYNVAGFVFEVELHDGEMQALPDNMTPFETGEASETIFTLKIGGDIRHDGTTPLYHPEKTAGEPYITLDTRDGKYIADMAPLPEIPVCGTLEMNSDFTEGRLTFSEKASARNRDFAFNNSLMLIFAFRTATLGTLLFHSSVVMNKGYGYMFLGKSGTGKSTHSSLWLKYIPETELLNDDNPAVRIMDDGDIRVFGTPWSGKTPCYKQKSVPVKAIVKLNQSPENRIMRLDTINSYASVMTSVSGFRAIKSMADGMHKSLGKLVAAIPCYLLDCRPDEEAALLCHDTVSKP